MMLRSSSEGTIREVDDLTDPRDLAIEAAEAAASKKAGDIVILHIGPLIEITDYFVICSGTSERQVGTIAEEIERRLRALGAKAFRREGEREMRWVLLDYLDFVVHVFHLEDREFYELERLWKDASRVEFSTDRVGTEAG